MGSGVGDWVGEIGEGGRREEIGCGGNGGVVLRGLLLGSGVDVRNGEGELVAARDGLRDYIVRLYAGGEEGFVGA